MRELARQDVGQRTSELSFGSAKFDSRIAWQQANSSEFAPASFNLSERACSMPRELRPESPSFGQTQQSMTKQQTSPKCKARSVNKPSVALRLFLGPPPSRWPPPGSARGPKGPAGCQRTRPGPMRPSPVRKHGQLEPLEPARESAVASASGAASGCSHLQPAPEWRNQNLVQ